MDKFDVKMIVMIGMETVLSLSFPRYGVHILHMPSTSSLRREVNKTAPTCLGVTREY
jgi:hypothetical protein